jgi:hypothetical protein
MTRILHRSMILSIASVIQWDSFESTNHNTWIVSAQALRRAQPPIPIPILQNPYFNYRLLFCYFNFFVYNLVSIRCNYPIPFLAVSWPPLILQVKFNAPFHSGGMWRVWWQIRSRICHRICLGCMTYPVKPPFLAFFFFSHVICICLSYLPNWTLSPTRHCILHRICQILLPV